MSLQVLLSKLYSSLSFKITLHKQILIHIKRETLLWCTSIALI